MDLINTLINKILEVIPVDQKTLGYILIGVGVLIILLVIIFFIASLTKKSPTQNYQSKFEGARFSGPLSTPQSRATLNQNSNLSNFNPASSPIRGNFAPKSIPTSSPSAPNEFGLSKLRSQVEMASEPAPIAQTSVRQTIPVVGLNQNFQASPQVAAQSAPQNLGFSSPNLGGNQSRSIPVGETNVASAQTFSAANPPAGFSMPKEAPVVAPKPINLDPNLVDYIKKTKSLGYPNSAIRSELIKVGWNPIDVDQALSLN